MLIWLVVLSIIDRGGIPASLIAGAAILKADGTELGLYCFFLSCTAAGTLGDLIMYKVGVFLRTSEPQENPFLSNQNSLLVKAKEAAGFINSAPKTWLVVGRVFALINQFVPMAAGLKNRPLLEVIWTSFLGNLLWFGMWIYIVMKYGELSENWGTPAKLTGAAAGLIAAYVSLKIVQSRIKPPQNPNP